MKWIHDYQLFLFDFDGLLVDTEKLHYQAYIDMCAHRGYQLEWSFARYSQAAHHTATALRDQVYAEFPSLQESEPDWAVLYQEKREVLLHLIETSPIPLLPGVESFLRLLDKHSIKRCVVTHSPLSLVEKIRKKNKVLETIPYWITREDYNHPKPNAECYQLAIDLHALPDDLVMGFEDSPRGFNALAQTRATPILVCPSDSKYLPTMFKEYSNLQYYPDFNLLLTSVF